MRAVSSPRTHVSSEKGSTRMSEAGKPSASRLRTVQSRAVATLFFVTLVLVNYILQNLLLSCFILQGITTYFQEGLIASAMRVHVVMVRGPIHRARLLCKPALSPSALVHNATS